MKWWCISVLKFSTADPDLSSEMAAGNLLSSSVSADSRCLVTRWWTCGCRWKVQWAAARPRPPPHPPPPRCPCLRGWAAVWYGRHRCSSAGRPGEWGPWLHHHLKSGKTHYPPYSDWRCGSHQKWAVWLSPSALLSSKSVEVNITSVRSNTNCLTLHAKINQTHGLTEMVWIHTYNHQWYFFSITGTNRMGCLSQI